MSALVHPAVCTDLGENIPNADHAVSVSLPTWKSNIGYEEGEEWVVGKMKNGYPRFFVHLSIRAFAAALVAKYGKQDEQAMLFPSTTTAQQCVEFIKAQGRTSKDVSSTDSVCALDLVLKKQTGLANASTPASTMLSVVMYPSQCAGLSKIFWQHSGEGVSSRRAEFFHKAFDEGLLVPRNVPTETVTPSTPIVKGPRRYQKDSLPAKTNGPSSIDTSKTVGRDNADSLQFVEERFGRNLGLSLAMQAKLAIRRRIAAPFTFDLDLTTSTATAIKEKETRGSQKLTEDDVYLYPTGMSSIFNSHRMLRKTRGELKSIMFGFPYIDTLKILEKFGAGAVFYGGGSESDIDDIERRCMAGEKFLALYCEFPGNPLLKTPNLRRIRELSTRWDFPLVVDETIGNFLNVDVLPAVDIVVNSLTKVFSGDANVMGGSLTLNPDGPWYESLKTTMELEYEDNMWPEDAVFMERNSRDFVSRNDRINANTEAVCEILLKSPIVKALYYPKYVESKPCYDEFKYSSGGYGGLLSIVFHSMDDAQLFYDSLHTEKGPSLGTNFTLSSPFVILAHYNELDWAESFGAESNLIRFSIGLEDTKSLCSVFEAALAAVQIGKTVHGVEWTGKLNSVVQM